MNKRVKVTLAILGGIDVTVYMFTPIFLASIWINVFGLETWHSYFFFGLGLFSTLFRAIKIGFKEKIK